MKKRRKHTTTKNTQPKPPVTRLMVISGDINGKFDVVTDFKTQEEFEVLSAEWFDHPDTNMWCIESLIDYIKTKQPKRICLLKKDYDEIVKGKVTPATEGEYLAENN